MKALFPQRLVVELARVAEAAATAAASSANTSPACVAEIVWRVIIVVGAAGSIIIIWISLSIGIQHLDISVDSNIKAALIFLLDNGECATEPATSLLLLYHYRFWLN